MATRFPKERPELPEAYRRIYLDHYRHNRDGEYRTTALSQRLEAWMHRMVAADLRSGSAIGPAGVAGPAQATLEIGAGTLNHLPYEPEAEPYDVVEPFAELYSDSPRLGRVRRVYADIADIDPSIRYDRIVTIAAFEHIPDLPPVVARAAILLEGEGALRVAIPNEGTILWALGTRVTGLEFRRRYGLDYQVLMRYEHVNTAGEIEDVLRSCFGAVSCKVLGLNRTFAFYRFYECRRPLRSAAEAILARTTSRPDAAVPAAGALGPPTIP
jgi:hypothetical protein